MVGTGENDGGSYGTNKRRQHDRLPDFVRISLGHFLNDAMQAVIPALFPILRSTAASFTLAAAPWRLGGLAAERPDIANAYFSFNLFPL
ncbi:hypothetical protein GTCCBUS3UF5_18690 [Geobacillus thermoleovorans CCB_US3_UF5]|uniref:Uncharacterized protein n=4 Tax=Geobacillus thermoleovorans group TaxID=1505648 RepID=A0A2Z3NE43_GEOTH|nr:hypothetical protein GTCCBUS3UF5_18690 [Geobacillus thermoleovorans CCB_US3_UF5]AOL34458.1 hypothetical protein BGM21_08025 [Geobacillus thermoleovorans]AUI35458.1 hypothetical protein CWI35_02045 [[Bacillus] caldolyticus]EQB94954.1 hypothetical protein GA8_14020 [Geobacillus sp. A8]PJW13533.1 hypothetical protein CV945_13645 [Geobacillus sp. Manikaran-105]QHN50903.1 hypothetical protein EPB69_08290 [Geobacillus stearothermophilus]RXS85531.1 hypothetical protein ETR37_14045 [Geobacillus sp